jgi:hypothetical protein
LGDKDFALAEGLELVHGVHGVSPSFFLPITPLRKPKTVWFKERVTP